MHLKDFIAKYNNQYLDFDGAYGAQCVDLFRFYCRDVLGISQPKGVTGAKDFWTNYDSDPNLYKNFTKIPNTPDFVPQPGDVWIWNANYGKYGHVAIESYYRATTSTFQCFSQNDPAGAKCVLKNYKYTCVYGVLRPKNQSNINEKGQTVDISNQDVNENGQKVEIGKDEMNILYFLDCDSEEVAERKLIEHLGINGKKCAWGDASGADTGGYLGSERRAVQLKQLEIDNLRADLTNAQNALAAKEKALQEMADSLVETVDRVARRDDQINGLQETVGTLEKQLKDAKAKIAQLEKQTNGACDNRPLWERLVERIKELLS